MGARCVRAPSKESKKGKSEIGIKLNSQLAQDRMNMNSYIDEIFSTSPQWNPRTRSLLAKTNCFVREGFTFGEQQISSEGSIETNSVRAISLEFLI